MQQARTRIFLAVSLLAFLLNALLPFYATYGGLSSANLTANSSPLFGEKILLCTATGYKWVSLAEFADWGQSLAADSDSGGQHNGSFECPLCYVFEDDIDGLAISQAYAAADYQQQQTTRYRFLNSPQRQQRLLLSGGYTRAPPQLIG